MAFLYYCNSSFQWLTTWIEKKQELTEADSERTWEAVSRKAQLRREAMMGVLGWDWVGEKEDNSSSIIHPPLCS